MWRRKCAMIAQTPCRSGCRGCRCDGGARKRNGPTASGGCPGRTRSSPVGAPADAGAVAAVRLAALPRPTRQAPGRPGRGAMRPAPGRAACGQAATTRPKGDPPQAGERPEASRGEARSGPAPAAVMPVPIGHHISGLVLTAGTPPDPTRLLARQGQDEVPSGPLRGSPVGPRGGSPAASGRGEHVQHRGRPAPGTGEPEGGSLPWERTHGNDQEMRSKPRLTTSCSRARRGVVHDGGRCRRDARCA